MTPITQINEDITVANAPRLDYTDNTTMSISIGPDYGHFSVQEFPRKLFSIFTNVHYFQAYSISMTELGPDSFFNCRNLDNVEFQYGTIGRIGARIASTCYYTQSLRFSNSPVDSIDQDAFVGLLNLKYLSFMNCSIKCIPPLLFQNTMNLNYIDLNFNNLTALHSETFANLPMLQSVMIAANFIRYLPNFNFNNTATRIGTSSVTFTMNDNPIIAIHPLLLTTLYLTTFKDGDDYITIYFNPSFAENTTCIDRNIISDPNVQNKYYGDIFTIGGQNTEWITQNITYQYLTTCYTAFTAEMASESLVTCRSIPKTTTTTTTISPGGSTNSGNGGVTVGGGSSSTGSEIGAGGQCASTLR